LIVNRQLNLCRTRVGSRVTILGQAKARPRPSRGTRQ
jgi:hypothetical protein